MRIPILFIFFCCFISCNNNEQTSTTKYPPLAPPKYHTDFNSKECIQQIQKAKTDIAEGKYVFIDYIRNIPRHADELEELLSAHGIEYIFGDYNCTLEQECYAYYMDSIIQVNKGKHFVRELRTKADSLFLSRWETKRYEYWDLDKSPRFDGVDPEIYIETEIIFPKNWDNIPIKFERQYLQINVYLDKQGKLEKWEFDELFNLKDSNKKHFPYFKKEIDRILSKMEQWSQPLLENKKVSCIMYLDIDLDQGNNESPLPF